MQKSNIKIKVIFLLLIFSTFCFNIITFAKEIDEKKLGKKISKEIEKQIKLYRSEEKETLLNTIANNLAKVSERPKIKYKVKILDVYDINAISIPGGYIYVTKGMLDFVQSNDELAALLAHEIAHNSHKHVLQQIEKQDKLNTKITLGAIGASLIAILASKNSAPEDVAIVFNAANAVGTSIMSGYSREFETDADKTSVEYLIKANYNPLAAYTLMKHLVKLEQQKPEIDYGILQTHPNPKERLKNVKNTLIKHHILFPDENINSTNAYIKKVKVENDIYNALFVRDTKVFTITSSADNLNLEERAKSYADNLNKAFKQGITSNDLKIYKILNLKNNYFIIGYFFKGQKKPLINIYEEDTKFYNKSTKEIADEVFLLILKELKRNTLENYP